MDTLKGIVLMILIFALIIGIWIGISYFEMKAFNRHSTTRATLVEAMFAKLRIISK